MTQPINKLMDEAIRRAQSAGLVPCRFVLDLDQRLELERVRKEWTFAPSDRTSRQETAYSGVEVDEAPNPNPPGQFALICRFVLEAVNPGEWSGAVTGPYHGLCIGGPFAGTTMTHLYRNRYVYPEAAFASAKPGEAIKPTGVYRHNPGGMVPTWVWSDEWRIPTVRSL